MKKTNPGEYGYFSYMRTKQLIKTILLFALPLVLFAAGFITTGTQKNMLTIVAVLGLLPASKSAVETVRYYMYHGCDDNLKQELTDLVNGLSHSYGLVFTTPDTGTYEVPSIAVRNNCICGLCPDPKRKTEKLEKHILQIMKQNGYNKVVVKIFDNKENYLTRLKQMKDSALENEKLDEAQRHLLHNISL